MKTIKFTAFSILFGLLVLASSCKKETNPADVTQTSSKISVTGQDAGIGLKSTLSGLTVNWVIGTDKMGLYSAEAGSNGTNAEYTAASTGATSSFTGAMTWGTGAHTFYAYYPWKSGSEVVTAVPISLLASQTQTGNTSDHIGPLDFTVASATASPGTVGQPVDVNLSFKHVFTLLEFDLKLASGSDTPLSSIELYSTDANILLTSGTINLTQSPTGDNSYTIGTPVGTNKVTLNVSGCTLTSGSVTKAYMMILPGNQVGSTSSDMTIKITSVAGVTVVVKPGINFVRGKRYTIDLTSLTFSPTVSDVDLNAYNTVTIGSQVWMASNLKTTKYNDNVTAIPIAPETTGTVPTTAAYCWYNNDMNTYKGTYGALYNWYAVDNNLATKDASNGGLNICPTGWHVPTSAEEDLLTAYLGGISVAGGKLKEVADHWTSPNTGATNESGFTALPGGDRYYNNGSLNSERNGTYGFWWSSSHSAYPNNGRDLLIQYNNSRGDSGDASDKGIMFFSVRCVRNL